jgi:hypothetical protein
MAKYKYRLLRWDRTPESKTEEALFNGVPLIIETDQENHQEVAQVIANKQLFSLPGRKTVYQLAKTGPGISLKVVFEDGHEEGYEIISEDIYKKM